MAESEIIYTASDVYKHLGVRDSTLRKYVDVLQREGYFFDTDKQGRRRYQEHDVITLEKLIELSKYDGMTLEKAAKIIMQQLDISNSDVQEKSIDEITPFDPQRQYSVMPKNIFKEQNQYLNQYLHEMEERIIDAFSEKLEHVESTEEERIKKRDEILLKTYREQQENKQLLLQIQEEIAAAKEVKKKWWKFW